MIPIPTTTGFRSQGTSEKGRIAWFLILLPLGLVFGTVWGLYQYFSEQEVLQQRVSKKISLDEISQILDNWSDKLGPRHFDDKASMEQLRLASKMLAGELQTNNSGLLDGSDKGVFEKNGQVWPTRWVEIPGANRDEVFFVVTSYDGTKELRDSAKIALMVSVAKSLGATPLDYSLRFVFTPSQLPLAEQKKWVEQQCLKQWEKQASACFCWLTIKGATHLMCDKTHGKPQLAIRRGQQKFSTAPA